MTDFKALVEADRGQSAHLVEVIDKTSFADWLAAQPSRGKASAAAVRFSGRPGDFAIIATDDPESWSVAIGVLDAKALDPWCLARASRTLPKGHYRVDRPVGHAMLGWLLGHYSFDTYKAVGVNNGASVLVASDAAQIDDTVALAEAVAMVRDMVNTPAEDMGPGDLQDAAQSLSDAHGGTCTVTKGAALAKGYPMIHAVGRAADPRNAPRLIEVEWGNPAHPRIAIVGKGVCFDTGGLDIKNAGNMRLMKKDMGGAAHALALARLVMGARLPVRLHLLIAAAENSIAGNAMRPGDVLKSRKGPTVEIGNTDAEGRLILGDALARACEEKPELILDFATLTGAARVALGPDLPALFANDDSLADALLSAGKTAHDPMWRMPLWSGYEDMLKSEVADIDNAPEGGMAGAVTAALFLARFVDPAIPWAHFDTFAWRPSAKPGRPKGGDALGLRAAFAMLRDRFK